MNDRHAPVVTMDEVAPAGPRSTTGTAITVLVSLNFPDLTDPVAELVRRFTSTALQTLDELGCTWRVVDTSAALPPVADTLRTDGVLVLGGGDVDSEIYGVPGPVPHEYGVDPAADQFTMDVIRGAVDAAVPVLGVCRGSQLLNLAFGGSLVPDLRDWSLHRGDYSGGLFIDEDVTVLPGTRLHEILGSRRLTVRSGHHQAVDRVAPELRLAAVADDGVVEGVEHPSAWAVGVQWHPEDSDGTGDDRLALFTALAEAAEAAKLSVSGPSSSGSRPWSAAP
jgi:putative glutamine amidotransferase